MRPALLPAIALCLAAATVTPVHAASFDCARAAKPDEIAVCANPQLSEFDSEMGALWFSYSKFPFLMGMNGDRMDAAQAFLQSRSSCGANVACLRAVYQARIEVLKVGITSAMQAYCAAQ